MPTIQQIISLPNLGPGSTGSNVTTLQQWLVQNGYMSQSQMNSGPGTYGPQTTAAVASWQASKGINTQGNPGYFGPLSKTYLQSSIAPPPPPPPPPAPTPSPTPSPSPSPTYTPPPPVTPTPPASSGQTPGTTGTANVGTINSGGVSVNLTKAITTAAFKSTAAYRALPQSVRDFVDIAYNLIEVGGEAEAKFFANAVAQAQAVADPYYKTQLALAKAEVMGSIAEKNSDYEFRSEIIRRARDEMMADVSSSKEFLTLEQQADVARTIKSFDEDLLTIADEAAEKGLTFATGARSRELAETRRAVQFGDVIQSSARKYNFQQKELELKAARGDTAAAKELESLAAGKGFALQGIGRAAEEVLGSANLPSIPGFTPVGGTTGKIEEEKRRAIASDTAGYLNLQRGFL